MNHDLTSQIDHPSIDFRISGIVQDPIQGIAFTESSHVDQCGSIPDHETVLGVQIKIFEPDVFEPKLKLLRRRVMPSAVEPPGLYESADCGIEGTVRPIGPRPKCIEETAQGCLEWEALAHGLAVETTDGTVAPPGTEFFFGVFKNTKKTLNPNQACLAVRGVGLQGSPGPHQIDVTADLYMKDRGREDGTLGEAPKNKCEVNSRNQDPEFHAVCLRVKIPGRFFNRVLSDFMNIQ